MTLATPYALGMLLGLALLFFALRGMDRKHNLLGGKLSNLGAEGGQGQPASFNFGLGSDGPPGSPGSSGGNVA